MNRDVPYQREAVDDILPWRALFRVGRNRIGRDFEPDSVVSANMAERVRWFHGQMVSSPSAGDRNPITSQWPGVKELNGAGSAWEVKMLSADRMNA